MNAVSLLSDVFVVEFAHTIAGSLCGMVLAQLGATVVKVESEAAPDLARRFPPFFHAEKSLESSGYFHSVNRGKCSVALDLSTPKGRELAACLVTKADAFVTNYSRRVCRALGLDPVRHRQRNPALVTARISGFGPGPYRDFAAYGPTASMSAGLGVLCGHDPATPIGVGYWPDIFTGIQAAFAIVSGLVERKATGNGRHVEVSMFDAMLEVLSPEFLAASAGEPYSVVDGNRDPRYAPQGVFACAGGSEWIAISVETDEAWGGLCRVLARADLANPPLDKAIGRHRHREEVENALRDEIRTWDALTLEASLRASGIAAGRFTVPSDHTPATLRPEFVSITDHPRAGPTYWFSPLSAALGQPAPTEPAPLLGQHTDEILINRLGLSERAVCELRARGVLR